MHLTGMIVVLKTQIIKNHKQLIWNQKDVGATSNLVQSLADW